MKRLALAVAAVCVAGSAQAERFSALTGAKLVEICTSKDKGTQTDCVAYIDGISDTVSIYQKLRPSDGSRGAVLPEYVCVKPEDTGPQIRDKFLTWVKSNQSLAQNTQASGVVLRALNSIYPCPNEQARR